jgi:hypothetical protein
MELHSRLDGPSSRPAKRYETDAARLGFAPDQYELIDDALDIEAEWGDFLKG